MEAPSFDVTESIFIKGDIAINKASVQKRHSEKMFVVDPNELVKGPIIGHEPVAIPKGNTRLQEQT